MKYVVSPSDCICKVRVEKGTYSAVFFARTHPHKSDCSKIVFFFLKYPWILFLDDIDGTGAKIIGESGDCF